MEEVLSKLESTDLGQNDKTSFDVLYKNWGRTDGQDQRRRDLLDTQKNNRFRNIDHYRGIMELVNAIEQRHLFDDGSRRARYRPTIQVAGFNRVLYKEVLMLSEWMTEKPSDFEDNWLVMPCPKGIRTLVVATNGSTKVFTKYGHFMFECRTTLPGGSPSGSKAKNCCVLDCFYYKNTNTMYICDILAWNSQQMTDGECDFRYFWLKTHLQDLPGISMLSKRNQLIFRILEKTPCDRASLNNLMMTYPLFKMADPGLDGLLFYHKLSHYVSGQTPLAVWLFPYMVPEILGQDITISPAYMLEKPENYTTQVEFIAEFDAKYAKKNAKMRPKKKYQNSMDTAEPENKPEDTAEKKDDATESMEADSVKTQPKKGRKKSKAKNSETMDAETVKDTSKENEKTSEVTEQKTENMESEAVESKEKTDGMDADTMDTPKE